MPVHQYTGKLLKLLNESMYWFLHCTFSFYYFSSVDFRSYRLTSCLILHRSIDPLSLQVFFFFPVLSINIFCCFTKICILHSNCVLIPMPSSFSNQHNILNCTYSCDFYIVESVILIPCTFLDILNATNIYQLPFLTFRLRPLSTSYYTTNYLYKYISHVTTAYWGPGPANRLLVSRPLVHRQKWTIISQFSFQNNHLVGRILII